jgi:hypothetical protein
MNQEIIKARTVRRKIDADARVDVEAGHESDGTTKTKRIV